VEKHVTLCLQQPDIPLFVLNEMNENSECLMGMGEEQNKLVIHSFFHHQLESEYPNINPEHVLLNIIGMTLYPFLGRAMMCGMQGASDDNFLLLMEERKKMIPIWIMATLNGTQRN
jgi:hypothetical protein